jgi:hypothetical protein
MARKGRVKTSERRKRKQASKWAASKSRRLFRACENPASHDDQTIISTYANSSPLLHTVFFVKKQRLQRRVSSFIQSISISYLNLGMRFFPFHWCPCGSLISSLCRMCRCVSLFYVPRWSTQLPGCELPGSSLRQLLPIFLSFLLLSSCSSTAFVLRAGGSRSGMLLLRTLVLLAAWCTGSTGRTAAILLE